MITVSGWNGNRAVFESNLMDETLQCVFVANGEIHAHQVRTFLEAAGIPAAERGEALRNTHGLTLDGLGGVAIMVADTTQIAPARFSHRQMQVHFALPMVRTISSPYPIPPSARYTCPTDR